MFTITQWNARSIRANFLEFSHYINNFQPDIIAIQETWLKPSHRATLRNYYQIRKDRLPQTGGGLIFYISNAVTAHEVDVTSIQDELNCIQVTRPCRLRIINVYHPPGQLHSETLTTISNLLDGPTLIVGDFNAHHTSWGNTFNDTSGATIYEWAMDNSITILNDSSPTHFARGSESSIDLTLASPELLPRADWHCHPSSLGSDHLPLITSLRLPHPPSHRTGIRSSPHWPTYTNECCSLFSSPPPSDPQGIASAFNTFIHTAADRARTLPQKNPRSTSLPWWTPNCTAAIRLKNRAHNRARRTLLDEHWKDYKLKLAKARRTLRRCKTDYWNKLCHSLSHISKLRNLYDLIRRIKGKRATHLIRHLVVNNIHLTSLTDIANTLATHFSSTAFPDFIPALPPPQTPAPDLSSLSLDRDLRPHELRMALDAAKDSTPGGDHIRVIHLRHLPPDGMDWLFKLLQTSWTSGILPPTWTHSIIVPILKPNKPPQLLDSYRPIALTASCCKLLERILNQRLIYFLETRQALPPVQMGFRSYRSIYNHLTMLTSDAIGTMNRHHVMVLTLLDLRSAYDSVSHAALLQKMAALGVGGRMLRWLGEFLANRTLQVRIGQTLSDVTSINRGLPQGSILSPTLFNIMLHDIPIPADHSAHLALYADDIAIWSESSRTTSAIHRIQTHLDQIQTWATTWGLAFSPPKCEYTIITNQRHITPPPLTIYNQRIPHKQQVKYLGFTIDRTLHWTPHITDTTAKVLKAIHTLRCISGFHWGTTRDTMLHLYRALIRPILDMNAIVLPHSQRITNLFQRLQNQALRLCLGARSTTSIEALHIEAQELPIHFRWQYLILTWVYRQAYNNVDHHFRQCWGQRTALQFYNPPLSRTTLIGLAVTLMHDYSLPNPFMYPPPLLPIPGLTMSDHITCLLPPDSGLHKDLPIPAVQDRVRTWMNQFPEHILMATDGSVQGPATGAGVFSAHPDNCLSFRLPDGTSIFDAELFAILTALQHRPAHHPALLISDSLSSMRAINNTGSKNNLVLAIHHILRTSPSPTHTVFLWVPSHHGIEANDEADRLASLGRQQVSEPPDHPPLSYNGCKRLVLQKINRQYYSTLDRKMRQYPHLLTSSLPWPSHFFSCRYTETAITRLRLGHTYLSDSLARCGIVDNSLCTICKIPETAQHFLLECQRYSSIRQKTIQSVCQRKNFTFSLQTLLTLGHSSTGRYDIELIRALEDFILQSKAKV